MPRFTQFAGSLLLFLLITGLLGAVPFVAPSEDNPPFRRDQLPIDTDTMVALSRYLTLLAQASPLENADDRRAAAQSLALALALDPANAGARDVIGLVSEGKPLPTPNPERLTRARAHLWQLHGWLSTPEAGADGNLLADLMGDAAAKLDPTHPAALALRDSPERGKWENWVAPRDQFEEPALGGADLDPSEDLESVMPAAKEDPGRTPFLLTKAALQTILVAPDEKNGNLAAYIVMVRMEAGADPPAMAADPTSSSAPVVPGLPATPGAAVSEVIPPPVGFHIDVPAAPGQAAVVASTVSEPIRAALLKLHGELPTTGVVTLSFPLGGYSVIDNGANLTGPGFILANAALTGKAAEGLVLAELDEDHQLAMPPFFWRLLDPLIKGSGGRIIVPAAAKDFFLSILVMEMPEFFLKYEVLLASTPEDFIALSAKEPSEEQAAVFSRFKAIKDRAGTSALGSYLANPYVRQRLQEIAEAAPYHLSSQLLALQGAGARPRYLPKKILAAEIWRVVEPAQDITRLNMASFEPAAIADLESLYERIRVGLDRLDRYTDTGDRDLLNRAKELSTQIRALARALSSRGDPGEQYESAVAILTPIISANTALRTELSEITGDPLPEAIGDAHGERQNPR